MLTIRHRIAALMIGACVLTGGCATGARTTAETGSAGTDATTTASVGASSGSGLASQPEIAAAEAREDAAAEGIARARATSLPTASFEALAGAAAGRGEAFGGRTTGNSYSYAFDVSIPLYRGGRGRAAVEAAEADFRASREVTLNQQVTTSYELALALLEIHRQKGVVAILDRQSSILGRFKRDVETEMHAGAASRVDVDEIGRQVSRLSIDRERARLAIAEASRTATRLGMDANAKLPDVRRLGLPADEAALVALAIAKNPRARERSARADAAKARIDEARGAALPTLTAGLRLEGERDTLPGVGQQVVGRAQVRLSVPLYSGGGTSAEIRQRYSESQAAVLEKDAAAMGVRAAVVSAVERRTLANRMLRLAESERRNASASLEGVRAERKVGERSTFDEIRAINDLYGAEINLNAARFEMTAAEYTLAAETGMIGGLFGMPPAQ